MGDELTREEATERLEAIYSETLEGDDLEKRLANIPKTLDKYEGKWPGLLKAAGKKFAKADSDELEDSEDEAEEESTEEEVTEPEVEKPAKKRGGFLSRFGKSKDEDPVEDESEDEEPADSEEESEDEEPADSEDDAEEESDDVEDEALEWTEGDVPPEEESEVAPSDENVDSTLEMALSMLEEGDSEGAISSLKQLVRSDGTNPEVWRGLAAYFMSVGRTGRSNVCEARAEALS